jgi:hypothetical protein
MADMDDRAARSAPGGEQSEAIGVDVRVPPARPGRRVERLLEIDGQKDGAIKVDGHRAN